MQLPHRVVPVRMESKLSPDEVLERIASLNERGQGSALRQAMQQRRALLARVTEDRIHLHRDVGRNLNAQLDATVHPEGTGSRVEGTARVATFTWVFPLLFVPIFLAVAFLLPLIVGEARIAVFAVLVFPVMGLIYWQSIRNRDGLVQLVRETVGARERNTREHDG